VTGHISVVDDMCHSSADHYMHPHSSSSYSRRMLTREPDSYGIANFRFLVLSEFCMSTKYHVTCAGLIRSAASSSRIPAETLLPLQENFDDGLSMTVVYFLYFLSLNCYKHAYIFCQ
jgi:hypothetical protein